jgi:N-acetylmuramoyl-L-alanine amidase
MNRRGTITLAVVLAAALTVILVLTLKGPSPAPPEPEASYVIALDAGHGGRDPGAEVDGVLEKDVNLDIVNKVKVLIDADPALDVVLTRDIDLYVSLENRIAIAEAAGADLYVSVHINSFGDPQVGGVETLVDDTRADGDPSYVLAAMVQDALSEATGMRDRGVRAQESYLERTTMPAISAEVGYLSNPTERQNLLDPAFQQIVAEAILCGIRTFLDYQYPVEE